VRWVGSSGLTILGSERVDLDSITVIVDQTSLPTHVHPYSGTRRPVLESDPCFSNVWMVTPLRNVHRSITKGRLLSYPVKGPCHE
jgi:hypothetical protein